MLLTKEVEVQATSQMISYYENLGYEIPRYYNKNNNKMLVKRGTKILVKVEHLPLNSGALVICECDNCKGIINTQWAVYNNHNHDGKTYCKKCANFKICRGGCRAAALACSNKIDGPDPYCKMKEVADNE